MNRRETVQVLSILQTNYPDSFRGRSNESVEAVVNLWATMFSDDDANKVTAAVMAHIASDDNRFMPPVGVIKKMLYKVSNPEGMTEVDAWNKVRKAIGNSVWEAKEEFAKLPPDLQKLVGSPNQLRDWATMDSDTLNSVVASNFQRGYRTTMARKQETAALPNSVRAVIGEASRHLALEENNEWQ